jgi:uncharacterized membrane protein YoaT (DUF817 family)
MKSTNVIRWMLAVIAILILITTQLNIIPDATNYLIPVLLISVLVINRVGKT